MSFPLNPDRDPRDDPRPGDVLTLYSGAIVKILARERWLFVFDMVYVECSHGIGKRWVRLSYLRKWARNASVMHRAPD